LAASFIFEASPLAHFGQSSRGDTLVAIEYTPELTGTIVL
jgi:hypothetical protein